MLMLAAPVRTRFARVLLAEVPEILRSCRPVRCHYGVLRPGFVLVEWLD